MVIRAAVAQLISCGKLLTFAFHLATVVPMRFSAALMAISVVVLVGVAACTPETSPVLPAPESSTTPLFASEEEALAAAEAAYANYLAVSDQVAERGGADTALYADVATPEMQVQLNESAESFLESGRHASGASTFDSMSLQQIFVDDEGVTTVTVYLCIDVTNVRVLSAENQDVTPSGRDNRLPLEVDFRGARDTNPKLLLGRSDIWSGDDFCGV